MYSRPKKKSIYFNTNYRTEMKLVRIVMHYLLQIDAIIFFLRIRLRGGGSQIDFTFFNVNPNIFQRKHKAHLTNCLETRFQNISNISLRVIRRRNYS